MDITKAIIGVIGSIISGIIGALLKIYFDRKKEDSKYKDIAEEKAAALTGKWKGNFEQQLKEGITAIEIIFDLRVLESGIIKGKANVPHENEPFEIVVKGGFYSDWFLKLEYENSQKNILQFGSFVFKLSSNSKKLTGCFVGYGHINEKIISGNIILEKA